MQSTPINGPGAKLNLIARTKPTSDIHRPKNAERYIAMRKLVAFAKPIKAGEETKAITRITPTAAIELTMTRAVEKLRARLKSDTFIPLAAAPSGSSPTCTS